MVEIETGKEFTPEEMEALRARVRAIKEAENLPLSRMAKEASLALGTFSNWLGDTYAGDNSRVAHEITKWLNVRASRAAVAATMPAAPGFLMTETASAIFDVLEHAQSMPELVVITGGSGVGKTFATRAYRDRSPNVWIITAQPSFGTPRAMLRDIAQALQIDEKYSAQHISRSIAAKLAATRGLLIVDEAQYLWSDAVDQLRTLYDQVEIGVALVGNERVYRRLVGDQIFSRVGMRLSREKSLARDVEIVLDAWEITGASERKLLRAIARKPGALRGLTKALRIAHMLAASDHRGINQDDISAAWSRVSNGNLEGGQ